ncbi:MAG: class I SAM-dependent methyltransferase [Thermoplasmatales archaeon]|nr:class I SAM-dependent methyltransferase [Candidatus Methanoperedenaceae archaeon]MCG2827132.1 class I SAM-dependent methyltransferase [Thermoplasmatales archaeon]
MLKVTEPEEIEEALFKYHSKLASVILSKIGYKRQRKIVEIGSGAGTFTIPLLKELDNNFELFYCVDSYTGPYHEDRNILKLKLKDVTTNKSVEIINKDAGEINKILSDIDLVIGHEILCDLNPKQVEQVISACYNVLKDGGLFVHSEFSPFSLNRSEEMLHILNKYSEEPISDTKWFSPNADELAGIAYKIGFKSVSVDYQKISIKFMKNAAVEMIGRWKTKSEFLEKYQDEINRVGIEYPMEQILYCIK